MKLRTLSSTVTILMTLLNGLASSTPTPDEPPKHGGMAKVRKIQHRHSSSTSSVASSTSTDSAPDSADTAGTRLERRDYNGQGTYFYPGQGACGWTATSKDHIAALNHDQYGDMSGRSPSCGKWIYIKNTQTGASTKAQIQDACPGCNYGDLDLSPAAFDDLAPESQGVVQIEWGFL